MKKILLATTAVVALSAGAAQAEINLDVGGFFKAYGAYSNQDTNNVRSFDIARKSQIFFSGETTLDNGLTVGAHTEMFGENNNSKTAAAINDNSIEESYLYFSGNWGRFNFGRENGAAYLLQVSAPGADADLDGQDIDFSFANIVGNVNQDYQHSGPNNDAQYSDKLTYLTPKFNGFQAGVTYTPSYEEKIIGQSLTGMSANNAAGAALDNLMEAGIRYDGQTDIIGLNGLGVHAGAGYSTADQQVTAAGEDDYKEYNFGLKFDINSFGFGAAYNTDNGAADAADTDTYTVGADYTVGAIKYGASYLNSQGQTATTDDELNRYMIGADYTYGPGMNFKGSVAQYDYDAATAINSNDATVFAVGTAVQF